MSQDRTFRNLRCKRLQLDEMWAWICCKEKNRTEEIARKQPDAGDVGLWVAVDGQKERRKDKRGDSRSTLSEANCYLVTLAT
jgi:hypothetical protein